MDFYAEMLSSVLPLQYHRYPWSSYARCHGDEPEVAQCGVCGVWRGWQVRNCIFHVFFVFYLLLWFSKLNSEMFSWIRLFEMGFAEQLQEIIRRLPDTRQTLLFSATLPKLLVEFARAGKINRFISTLLGLIQLSPSHNIETLWCK